MKKLNVLLFTLSISTIIYAVDVEDNVKDYKKSDNWVSFAITDNHFGNTLATRAATEDLRTNSTLAFTYPTNNKCKIAPAELIIKLSEPLSESSTHEVYGNLQFDNLPVERIEATVQNEAGSNFTFLTINYKNMDEKVKKSKNMSINFKGYGVINFSMNGAQNAIQDAKSICNNFSY